MIIEEFRAGIRPKFYAARGVIKVLTIISIPRELSRLSTEPWP